MHLVLVVIIMGLGGKKLGEIKVIVWREAEGVSHKVKVEHFFRAGVDPSGILSELLSYFSFF